MEQQNRKTLGDFPELVNQLHPSLNQGLMHYGAPINPTELASMSNKRIWWKCDVAEDHVWQTPVHTRTSGSKCPFCLNQRASVTNSLASLFPEIAKEFHPTKNGTLTAGDLPAGSGRVVWWKCDVANDHEWRTSPSKRTGVDKTGCPCCSVPSKKLSVTNRLDVLYPSLIVDWHPANPKGPEEYFHSSNSKVWWLCGTCGHEWKSVISNRARLSSGCPSCRGMVVHSSGGNSLGDLSEIAKIQWHDNKNGSANPYQYRPSASKRVWWICDFCSHEWQTSINSRFDRAGNCHKGCNICSTEIGSAKLRKSKQEIIETANEIHNSKYRYEWEDIGIKNQRQNVPIICPEHGEFFQVLSTHIHGGSGCTICAKQEGWGGFNPSKNGFFYVNEVRNGQGDLIFYKAGISNQWKKRLAQLQKGLPDDFKMNNLEVIEFKNGEEAQQLERRLLRLAKENGWKAPPRSFDGGHELFLENPLSHARNFGLV